MSGLREHLFKQLEKLEAGEIDCEQAGAVNGLAGTLIKSAELQLRFEQLKGASDIPAHLSDMRLVPPLTDTSKS